MKSAAKMSSEDRRTAIIGAAARVFVEKGFYRTTTRELAEAAGVSEALLFRHFPNKEAIYSAIQKTCFKKEEARLIERLESLKPSTSALVFLVHDIVSHVLGGKPQEEILLFFRLTLRSLMDEGEFTRLAIQGGISRWVSKVEECFLAAGRSGDLIDAPVQPRMAGWIVHQLISGFMIHSLPDRPVIDYGVSQQEGVRQVTLFCLRGMGLKEGAIRRHLQDIAEATPPQQEKAAKKLQKKNTQAFP